MSSGLGHRLYQPGNSPIHRLPAQVKLVVALAFVITVVATPAHAMWAFGLHALALAVVAGLAGLTLRFLTTALIVELPFVAFAFMLPFVASGPEVAIGPLSLSESGLWGAWSILAKATIGVATSALLAATTSPSALVEGLQRLRVPTLLVSILSFMVRYADLVTDEMARMRIARESRGFAGRGPRAWRVLTATAGALFVRSYERGERVHLAMLSRGHTGALPLLARVRATTGEWLAASALPAAGLTIAVLAW